MVITAQALSLPEAKGISVWQTARSSAEVIAEVIGFGAAEFMPHGGQVLHPRNAGRGGTPVTSL